jgi:hypothetical protein
MGASQKIKQWNVAELINAARISNLFYTDRGRLMISVYEVLQGRVISIQVYERMNLLA